MATKQPLITVITVSYNSEKHIEDTIKSVLAQTYKNIEYVIVDGNSNDSTLNIVKSYENHFKGKMRWVSEKDNGIYDAMNKGLSLVKDLNSYVIFLNSDDYFDSKDSIKNIIGKSNDEDFIYGMIRLVDSGFEEPTGTHVNLSTLAYKNIPHPAVFAKKATFLQVGEFSTEYKIASDYEFFVKVFLDEKISKAFIPEIVTSMRIGGVSSTNVKKSFAEKLKIIKRLYPRDIYLKSLLYITCYELPRNKGRLIMDKYACLNIWRDVRKYAKKIIGSNTDTRS